MAKSRLVADHTRGMGITSGQRRCNDLFRGKKVELLLSFSRAVGSGEPYRSDESSLLIIQYFGI